MLAHLLLNQLQIVVFCIETQHIKRVLELCRNNDCYCNGFTKANTIVPELVFRAVLIQYTKESIQSLGLPVTRVLSQG